jgi:hypothetical protein
MIAGLPGVTASSGAVAAFLVVACIGSVLVLFVSPSKIRAPAALTDLAELPAGAPTEAQCAAYLHCIEAMDAVQRDYVVRIRRAPQGPFWRVRLMSRWTLDGTIEVARLGAEPGAPDQIPALRRILAVAARAGSESDQTRLGVALVRGYQALVFRNALPPHLFAALYQPLEGVVPLPPHLRVPEPDFSGFIRSLAGRTPTAAPA